MVKKQYGKKVEKTDIVPNNNELIYRPSDAVQALLLQAKGHLDVCKITKSLKYRFLRDKTEGEYRQWSLERFNGYCPDELSHLEDWQAKFFDDETRSKVQGMSQKVVNRRKRVVVDAINTKDLLSQKGADIINDMKTYYHLLDDRDSGYKELSLAFTYAGTAWSMSVWNNTENRLEMVEIDGDEMFYPYINVKTEEDQPYMFYIKKVDYFLAQRKYGKSENFKYVKTGIIEFQNDEIENNDFIYDFKVNELKDNEVEEAHYIWHDDKGDKQYMIFLNGIPVRTFTEVDGKAIPKKYTWQHGKYPWTVGRFELCSTKFMLGKSLPDKIFNSVDYMTKLRRFSIDYATMALFPPLKNTTGQDIYSDIFKPAQVATFQSTTGDIAPLFPMGQLTPAMNVEQILQRQVDKNSIDQRQMGVSGGTKITARERLANDEAFNEIMGHYMSEFNKFIKRHEIKEIYNILQFATVKTMKEVTGEDVEKYIVLENQNLGDGRYGNKVIQFENPESDTLPYEDVVKKIDELKQEEVLLENQSGIPTKIIKVSEKFIKSIPIRFKTIVDTTTDVSKAMDEERFFQFIQIVNPVFGTFYDQSEIARTGLRLFRSVFDEDKVYKGEPKEEQSLTPPTDVSVKEETKNVLPQELGALSE